MQANSQIEFAKLQQKERTDATKLQLEQFGLMIKQGADQASLQAKFEEIQAKIELGYQELGLKKEALMAQLQTEMSKKELETFRAMLDARVADHTMSLDESQQQLEAFSRQVEARDHELSLQERVATEQRLQEEHQINQVTRLADTLKVEAPKQAPINLRIDASKSLKL